MRAEILGTATFATGKERDGGAMVLRRAQGLVQCQ